MATKINYPPESECFVSGTQKRVVFSVEFNGTQVFTSDNDVQAVGFALGLHQNSNVAHNIRVVDPKGVTVTILTLA